MDSQLATFQIYPNPTQQIANINFSEMPESHWPIQLVVVDVSGSEVYKTRLANTKPIAIDCQNLLPGIYFVTAIASTGNSVCQKLIIN